MSRNLEENKFRKELKHLDTFFPEVESARLRAPAGGENFCVGGNFREIIDNS